MISEESVQALAMLRLRTLSLICLLVSLPRHGNSVDLELVLDKEKVCRTQNVTLTCIASNPSDITFTVHKKGTPMTLPSNNVVLNTTVAMTTLPVRSVEKYIDQSYDVLEFDCRDSGGNDDYQLLGIYDDPEPVSNFSCIVTDWDVNMTCTWSHTLVEQDTRNISVQWMDVYGCEKKSCASKSDNSCTINRDFTFRTVSVVVTTTSGCGINLTQCFNVNTETVVKPASVASITSQAINSTCVKVTWKVKKPVHVFKQFFEISYHSLGRPSEVQILDNIKDTHADICNLYPGTKYNLEVRAKPINEHRNGSSAKCDHCRELDVECDCLNGDGYWSDPRSVTVTTYTDVPRVSPKIEAGSWAWDPRECKTADSGRNVTIYWQPLETKDKNGDLTAYIVNFTGVLPEVQTKPDRTWVTKEIRCNEPYNVTVQARNVNGSSPIQQYIAIPASQKGVHPPEAVVEKNKTTGVVHVTWGPVYRTDIDHYSVFWCRKINGECDTNSIVQWKASNSTTVEFTKLDSSDAYMFGVSMATEAGNSGITWTRCIYEKDANPRAPSNVKVAEGIQNNALFVTWSPAACESGQPYVDRYNVTCCHDNHCRYETTRNSSVFVKDLESGVPYSVQVQGITKDNRTGSWSKIIKATPIDKPSSTGAKVSYGLIGVIGFVLLLIGFAWFCRWCIQKRNVPIKDVMPMIEESIPNNVTDTAVEVEPLVEGSDSLSHHEEEIYTTPLLSPQLSDESGFVEGQNNHCQDDYVDDSVNIVEKNKAKLSRGTRDATAPEYVHISTLDNQFKALDGEALHSEGEIQDKTVCMEKTQTELLSGLCEERVDIHTLNSQYVASDNETELTENEMQNKHACRVKNVDGYVKSTEIFENTFSTTESASARSGAVPSQAPDRCTSVKAESVPNCGYITHGQAESIGNAEAASQGDYKPGPSCAEMVSSQMVDINYTTHDLPLSGTTAIKSLTKKTDQLSDNSMDNRYVSHHVADGTIGCSLNDRSLDNPYVPHRESEGNIDGNLIDRSMDTGYVPDRESEGNINGCLNDTSMDTGYVPYRTTEGNINGCLNDRSMDTAYVPYRTTEGNNNGCLNDRSVDTSYVPYRTAEGNNNGCLNDRSMDIAYVPYRTAENDRSMDTGYVPHRTAKGNINYCLNDRSMDTAYVPYRTTEGNNNGCLNDRSMDTGYVPHRTAEGNNNGCLNDRSMDTGYVPYSTAEGDINGSLINP